jgi:hypothetical protein
VNRSYSGRKISDSLGNVTVGGGKKDGMAAGGDAMANSLSTCSITENIYYSQLSVAILLQPEPVSHCIIEVKDCVLSPSVLSSCGLPSLPRVYF